MENPDLGIQEIEVRLEAGMRDGPTSSRVMVVDINNDTREKAKPVVWDPQFGWFRTPEPQSEWLPIDETAASGKIDRPFVEKLIGNRYYHQVNAWAVVHAGAGVL